jgi:hypothetical protein
MSTRAVDVTAGRPDPLRHVWLGMFVKEACSGVVVSERVVGEPLNSPSVAAGVTKCVPGRQQVRKLIVQLVLEPVKGTLALDDSRQPSPSLFITDLFGEVDHVLVPDVGRQRIDADQIQLVEIDGVWPSMPVSDVQNTTAPVPGLISHRCS